MTAFTVTITDTHKLAGITAARNAYNAALPDTYDANHVVVTPKVGTIALDQDYVQFVMDSASLSYSKQYNT